MIGSLEVVGWATEYQPTTSAIWGASDGVLRDPRFEWPEPYAPAHRGPWARAKEWWNTEPEAYKSLTLPSRQLRYPAEKPSPQPPRTAPVPLPVRPQPLCECGCGEPVKTCISGVWSRWRPGHQLR